MKKNEIKVYYAKVPNMGDILNREVIKKCFGYDVKRKSYLFGKVSGIGSGLGNYTLEGQWWKKILKQISGIVSPNVYIWGTGFVNYKEHDEKLYKKNIQFCAVRGKLSRDRIAKLTGKDMSNIPMGDAGILASNLLDEKIDKIYDVGIIAHYKEKNEPIFKELYNKFPNATIIDVQDTPMNVTKKIAECKTIISSSLHGLIIADSLRVPNIHIVVTDNLLGDGFKFDDYYSAYGLQHDFVNTNKETINTLDEIVKRYKITDKMVEEKKNNMINSFPYPKVK